MKEDFWNYFRKSVRLEGLFLGKAFSVVQFQLDRYSSSSGFRSHWSCSGSAFTPWETHLTVLVLVRLLGVLFCSAPRVPRRVFAWGLGFVRRLPLACAYAWRQEQPLLSPMQLPHSRWVDRSRCSEFLVLDSVCRQWLAQTKLTSETPDGRQYKVQAKGSTVLGWESSKTTKDSQSHKKSHEQHQIIFWTIRGGYGSLPSKQGFRGKSQQKVHPNVRQNLCRTVSLWYPFCPQWESSGLAPEYVSFFPLIKGYDMAMFQRLISFLCNVTALTNISGEPLKSGRQSHQSAHTFTRSPPL